MSATQKKISTAHTRIQRRITKAYADLHALQESCKHPSADKKYGSSTGNYDPSSDCYWIDWHCVDCGKKWRTDQ
jgi:hypothetical protein